jgi:hypothetical protein
MTWNIPAIPFARTSSRHQNVLPHEKDGAATGIRSPGSDENDDRRAAAFRAARTQVIARHRNRRESAPIGEYAAPVRSVRWNDESRAGPTGAPQ